MVEPIRSARLARLQETYLYLCTPLRHDLASFVDLVCRSGVDAVQVREKTLEARNELRTIAEASRVARACNALVSVNDRADLAVLARADILHVGQGDLSPSDARRIVGTDILIGQSTHTAAQIDAVINDRDVDYFCVGPVYPTATKPDRPAVGLQLIELAASIGTRKPWFAIGGIDLDSIADVVAAGAERVVVVRAITEEPTPAAAAAAAKALRSHLA